MYKIYFKNQAKEYYFPIYRKTINETLLLFFTYWKLVPSILITDSDDVGILEAINGEIINLEQNDIDKLKETLSIFGRIEIEYLNFDELMLIYANKLKELELKKDSKTAYELKKIDVNILALCAKENIDLKNYSYKNIEGILDCIEIKEYKVIQEHFSGLKDELDNGKTLIVMPIDRIEFDGRPIISNYYFMPPNTINYKKEFILNNSLFGNQLRDATAWLTSFSIDVLVNHHCVVFSYDLNWNDFKSYLNHNDDITLLNLLSSSTNELFNLIKYHCCDLNLPDTLISPVGAWHSSNDMMGALLFHKDEGSYLISGSAIESSRVVKGIGLELCDTSLIEEQLNSLRVDSEVIRVIKYSISIYNDALYSNDSTTKFIKMMTLFEYIAFPEQYQNFQKTKKYIICHNSQCRTQYHELSTRFRTLSEEYRTEIVHNGKTLENIIPILDDRKALLRELQGYYTNVIKSMFSYKDNSWEEFSDYRKNLISTYS